MSELYHYTTAIGLAGIVRDRKIWATDFRFMNDPGELEYGISVFDLVFKDHAYLLGEHKDNVAKHVHSFSNGNRDFSEQSVYITSFSREPDLLSQWRGYNNGLGFNIGFSEDALTSFAADRYRAGGLQKVIYNKEEQYSAMHSAFIDFRENAENPSLTGATYYFERQLAAKIMTFKDIGFHEEKESRIIKIQGKDASKYIITAQGFKPYIEIPLVDFRTGHWWQGLIKSVCIGPAVSRLQLDPVKMLIKQAGINLDPVKSAIPYIAT